MKVIDAHAHMFCMGMEESENDFLGNRTTEDFSHSIEDNTKAWEKAAEKFGIEKALFIAISSWNQDFLRFVVSSEKFAGIAAVNPLQKNARKDLEKCVEAGCIGIKLYPVSGKFHVNDERAEWVYDFAAERKMPIVIHFGITLFRDSDLGYGNPLDIDSIAGKYPETDFVVAHFGTTFFRETLMLAYGRENVCIDTSGKNGWVKFVPQKIGLRNVLEKSLEAFGAERILFGTDTRIFPHGYRDYVLKEQEKILEEIGVKESEKRKIFYSNAKRVFNL